MHTADAVDAVTSLWDPVMELARGLDADDWSRPTPCGDWDVKDLLGHLSGVQRLFDAGVHLPAPEGWSAPEGASPLDAWTAELAAARHDWTSAQVLAELDEARAGHLQRAEAVADWSGPTQGPLGETSEEGLLRVRAFDLRTHRQDLRAAFGQPLAVDDATPGALLAYGYVLDLVPWMAARRAGLPDGATMRLRLGAPLNEERVVRVEGRRAAWAPGADGGEDLVAVAPGTLVLLASGRTSPDAARDAGHLAWSGGHGEAFVRGARLF
jgi:uncharacterized protein (TIGR03083 family)